MLFDVRFFNATSINSILKIRISSKIAFQCSAAEAENGDQMILQLKRF